MTGATLASFVLAAVFFVMELLVFKTLGWKTALQPLVVAGEGMSYMYRIGSAHPISQGTSRL